MKKQEIDNYARECHRLIVIEKGVHESCMSINEMLCARIVELLDEKNTVTIRDPRNGGDCHVVSREQSIRMDCP